MQNPPPPPPRIRNIPLWEEHCRKIHARALELVEGKSGVIDAAVAIRMLASRALASEDADFAVFHAIASESLGLPIGPVRQYWAKDALEREDVKIHALEERWRPAAVESARKLVERYGWALDARRRRRAAGHAE